MILWLDLETTGLEPREGSILEMALVLTDDDLKEISSFSTLVKPLHLRGLEVMDDFVKTMHAKNGLLDELFVDYGVNAMLSPGLPRLNEVERSALDWLELTSGIKEAKALRAMPLGGSSVGFDRAWLHEHIPSFEGLFSHRNADVSAINEFAKRWLPGIYAERLGLGPDGKPAPGHRALPDIRDSIATARYYHGSIFNKAFFPRTP